MYQMCALMFTIDVYKKKMNQDVIILICNHVGCDRIGGCGFQEDTNATSSWKNTLKKLHVSTCYHWSGQITPCV